MTDQITFFVPGVPQALKRHRTFQRGSHVGSYDPSNGDKADFLALSMNHRPTEPIAGPIMLTVEFRFPRPKAHYRGKCAERRPNAPMYHTGRPDVDNLTKFVLDALNGVFWRDDSGVCIIKAAKLYAESPGVNVTIEPLQDFRL